MLRPVLALFVLATAACAPAPSELNPPDTGWWMRDYSVTHDPHHPWQFQRYDFDGGR
jgi:hypothetical protein